MASLPDIRKKVDEDPDFSNIYRGNLKKNIVSYNILLCNLWKIWKDDYLVNLREHHSVLAKRKQGWVYPLIGDIILPKDQLPRAKWMLCRVDELIQGKDGQVRAVKVKLGDGHVYKRPIQH